MLFYNFVWDAIFPTWIVEGFDYIVGGIQPGWSFEWGRLENIGEFSGQLPSLGRIKKKVLSALG